MKTFELVYSVEVTIVQPIFVGTSRERDRERRQTMCISGADNLSKALTHAITDGMFYIARGYVGVEMRVIASCAACGGSGEVAKGGRVLFAKKKCPACKGVQPAQPFSEPIQVTTGTTVGLKVVCE